MNWLKRMRVHNARQPKGFWGMVTLSNMNDDHAELTDEGLALLTIKKDAVCLDLGCGGGRTLSRLSALAPEGKIYGVDISETSVLCAKKYNAKEVKSGKITVKRGRAYAIPYPAETFDVITAVETFYFWENKPLALKNIRDVLKVGGSLLIMLDAYEDGSGDMDEVKREIELELNTPEDINKMLTDAGFSAVDVIVSGKKLYAKAVK